MSRFQKYFGKIKQKLFASDDTGSVKKAVLMYHRVADINSATDPWNLAVAPQNFHDHMQWLSSHCEVLPLEALLNYRGLKPAIALTFDDGYADNLYHALPVLEKFKLPATIFISTGFTDSNTMFWWDDLARIFFISNKLPQSLSLAGSTTYEIHLAEDADFSTRSFEEFSDSWMPWDPAPSKRHKAYYEIWQLLRKSAANEVQAYMQQLHQWAGVSSQGAKDDLPMTTEQLIAIDKIPYITLGAHTQNHYSLKNLSSEDQNIEIIGGKKILEALLDRQIMTFSYPFGDYSKESLKLMKMARFQLACTTVNSCVPVKNSPYLLPRLEINNWSKNKFESIMLKNLSTTGSVK